MRIKALTGGLAALLLAAAAPAALAAGKTERVSVGPGGVQGDDDSSRPSISGNGSVVAFESGASDFAAGDANGFADIYVRNRAAGTTVRASVSTSGAGADDVSFTPLITKEGRRVAFVSYASNLAANDTNGDRDVFVRDLEAKTTVRASVGPGGQQLEGVNGLMGISADAQVVAFTTQDALGNDEYLNTLLTRDLKAGTTTVESRNAKGELGNGYFNDGAMSLDGRYLAFDTESTNLVPGADSGRTNVYVKDRAQGTFQLVNVRPDGRPGGGDAFTLAISGDGGVVAFGAVGDDLVAGSGPTDLLLPYVRDMRTGKTTKLAVTARGEAPNSDVYVEGISADGRYVLFYTQASNILPGDVNGEDDVFVHDRLAGRTVLASARENGGFARKGESALCSISANGRAVAFESDAANLVSGDTNKAYDVFARKLPPLAPAP